LSLTVLDMVFCSGSVDSRAPCCGEAVDIELHLMHRRGPRRMTMMGISIVKDKWGRAASKTVLLVTAN